MTPTEEHEFYARPENQTPQGPPRRRKELMTVPGAGCEEPTSGPGAGSG